MTSIRKTIRGNLATLIGGMRVADGYNLNWSPCNQIDTSQRYNVIPDGDNGFIYVPHAQITVADEECVDDDDASWYETYTNEMMVEIRIDAPLVVEMVNPNFSIDDMIDYAIDDLKRVIGRNPSLLDSGCLPVMYKTAKKSELYKTGDIFLPKYIETTWLVRYTQSRIEPSQIA